VGATAVGEGRGGREVVQAVDGVDVLGWEEGSGKGRKERSRVAGFSFRSRQGREGAWRWKALLEEKRGGDGYSDGKSGVVARGLRRKGRGLHRAMEHSKQMSQAGMDDTTTKKEYKALKIRSFLHRAASAYLIELPDGWGKILTPRTETYPNSSSMSFLIILPQQGTTRPRIPHPFPQSRISSITSSLR
jgi:hypothetical protein